MMMKRVSRLTGLLVMVALTTALTGQDATVVLEYMRIPPGGDAAYLEVEEAWQQIHKKRIELGLITGWQLWRNVYAGADDPYQYVVVTWYDNYAQTFKPMPDGFYQGFFDGTDSEIFAKTGDSRVIAHRAVSHRIAVAENAQNAQFIFVNQMQVKQGNGGDYEDLETSVYKPVHEASIDKGLRSHWSLWSNYPRAKGEAPYVTVDGYKNGEQINATTDENIFASVHPGMNMDEINEKTNMLRKIESTELWELVMQVMPEGE